MNRDGEIIDENRYRVIVRGHLSAEEMRRLTGWSGTVEHAWWRAAHPKYTHRRIIELPRGDYVVARKGRGPGAFAVTILTIRRSA